MSFQMSSKSSDRNSTATRSRAVLIAAAVVATTIPMAMGAVPKLKGPASFLGQTVSHSVIAGVSTTNSASAIGGMQGAVGLDEKDVFDNATEANLAWANAAGGAYNTAANWSPAQVPAAIDNLSFNLASTYTVTGGAPGLGNSLQVRNGNVTLSGGTTTLSSTATTDVIGGTVANMSLIVSSATNPTLTVNGGATVNYNQGYAGELTGQSGKLVVTGAGTKLTPTVVATNGRFGINEGTGAIEVTNGATVEARLFEFGRQANSQGTVLIDNGTLTGLVLGQVIVARGGDGIAATNANITVNARNNSVINQSATGNLFVSANPGTTGTLNVESGSTWTANQLTGATDNGNTTANMNVSSGGQLIGQLLFTGDTIDGLSRTNINVTGAGSLYSVAQVSVINGGGGALADGFGITTINVSNGGEMRSGRWNINQNGNITNAAIDAEVNMTVTGAGSKLTAVGDSVTAAAYIVMGFGDNSKDSLTIADGGLAQVAAGGFFDAGGAVGSESTVTVTGAGSKLDGADGLQIASGFGTASLTVSNGGEATGTNMFAGSGRDATVGTANITVTGAGSKIVNPGVAVLGGGDDGTLPNGGGITNVDVLAGGVFNIGRGNIGQDPATFLDGSDGAVTSIDVDGVGSVFATTGDAVTGVGNVAGYLDLNFGDGSKTTVNVTNGGVIDVMVDSLDSTLDGFTDLAGSTNSVGVINVSGVGSTFNAGVQLSISNNDTATNMNGTVNVFNGGTLTTESDNLGSFGSVFMGVDVSTGSSAVMNIGLETGGTAADADSLVDIDGVFFVGGSYVSSVATPGVASTVNLNNGALTAGAIGVFGGSTLNHKLGLVLGGQLIVTGANASYVAGTSGSAADRLTIVGFGNLEVSDGAKFDLGKSSMILASDAADPEAASEASVRAQIIAGRNGGTWNGLNGISSSTAAANNAYAVGYAPSSVVGTTFAGVDIVTDVGLDTAIYVATTIRGDTNLSGTVDFDDLLALAQNYNTVGTGVWYKGDFDYNGNINFDDLLSLAQNYNNSALSGSEFMTGSFEGDWAYALTLVPEPTSLTMLGVAGAFLGRRRSR